MSTDCDSSVATADKTSTKGSISPSTSPPSSPRLHKQARCIITHSTETPAHQENFVSTFHKLEIYEITGVQFTHYNITHHNRTRFCYCVSDYELAQMKLRGAPYFCQDPSDLTEVILLQNDQPIFNIILNPKGDEETILMELFNSNTDLPTFHFPRKTFKRAFDIFLTDLALRIERSRPPPKAT